MCRWFALVLHWFCIGFALVRIGYIGLLICIGLPATGWVSSVGKYVDEHEDPLQATTGAKFAIAVVNETATSHLCLHLCGVEKDPDLLGHLMKEDHSTAAFPICEYWLDIGQPDNLKQAHGDFKDVFE